MASSDLTDLAVSNKDNLGVGALLVVGCHSLHNGSGTLRRRVVVADATAVGLSTTSRIDNSLRASSRVRRLDGVDEASCSSITI